MFDTRNVAKFAIGENLTGNHKHAIQKVVRHSLPPFAINTFEDSILEQISLPGHASAKEIGLTKFGVRYYDPSLGRWTQQDPVGVSLGALNSTVACVDTTSIAVSSTNMVLYSLDTCIEIGKGKIEAKIFLAGGDLLCAKDFVFQVTSLWFARH